MQFQYQLKRLFESERVWYIPHKLKKSSHIIKLDPVVQGGILRVGGRLHQSALPLDVKHPIILPKDHHVSTLLLRHFHQETGHSGRNYNLSRLRKRFWIPQADSAIRKILSKCVTCRKISAKPGEQRMGSLPQDRLTTDKPPFTNVGIDYFGPLRSGVGGAQSRDMVCRSHVLLSGRFTLKLSIRSRLTLVLTHS